MEGILIDGNIKKKGAMSFHQNLGRCINQLKLARFDSCPQVRMVIQVIPVSATADISNRKLAWST